MNIKDFLTEQWMNDYERQARFNMTDTSALPMGMEELLAFEPDLLTVSFWITDGLPVIPLFVGNPFFI